MSALDFLRAEVARLRAVCDAATSGPWFRFLSIEAGHEAIRAAPGWLLEASSVGTRADCDLVVAARSALPALLGVVEETMKKHLKVGDYCLCGSMWPCDDPRIVSAARALGWEGE